MSRLFSPFRSEKSKLLLPPHNVPSPSFAPLTLFWMLCKKSKAAAVTPTVTTGRLEYQSKGLSSLLHCAVYSVLIAKGYWMNAWVHVVKFTLSDSGLIVSG